PKTYFFGTGELTCHHFIRSIREDAIEAGKQRDDEWMADQASIRFDGEALKWFESLDEEVQTDWKRLRRAILYRFAEPASENITPVCSGYQVPQSLELQFKGESETESQEFIRRIRQRGVAEGRENDSEWMIRLVHPCFVGKALKWHASLPMDVQNSWKALERAILLDFPYNPTFTISPARIRVNDWYTFVPPSSSLRSLRSYTDWIDQARERRKLYESSPNKSSPCWLLIESEKDIPYNAIRTGSDGEGKAMYSARAWYQNNGLIVGKCAPNLPGAHIPLHKQEIDKVTPFEILVGSPSYFKWVAIPEKLPSDHQAITPSPFNGVEAGIENAIVDTRATFISQAWVDNSWHPGKAHSESPFVFTGFGGKETLTYSVRVLAWAE
ncbi:hypothetical protein FRB90_006491, partial [Tulasnella sp. 427]